MTKKEFVANLATRTGLTKTEVENFVTAFQEEVTQLYKSGETLQLPGFMSFGVKDRASRTSVNPSTKEKIVIPARRVAYAKVSSKVNEQIL